MMANLAEISNTFAALNEEKTTKLLNRMLQIGQFCMAL